MSKSEIGDDGTYSGEGLSHIAFPMGGMGAGMICLDGTGSLSHVSIRNRPEILNQPYVYAAVCVKADTNVARVLEGPVPTRKLFGPPGSGSGAMDTTFGLPRFSSASFKARFPFATVALRDDNVGLGVEITGWSPFIPGDAHASSLPVAALEYSFRNTTNLPVAAVYSFNAMNFMADHPWMRSRHLGSKDSGGDAVLPAPKGFTLWQPGTADRPWDQGGFSASVDADEAKVNCVWFRGDWFDARSLVWSDVERGACYERGPVSGGAPSPGGSICVPFDLDPGEVRTITLSLSWYVPESNLSYGTDQPSSYYQPWYVGQFADIDSISRYWRGNYATLRQQTLKFTECFYDTSLPPKVVEAVAANLSILKSPTVLRQTDGSVWCWEGCGDEAGSCAGSCTHVWNYAQALPHLFPDLERSLRHTEFNHSQDETGHQRFRSALPTRPAAHDGPAAADGQLGGIMKLFREWRISDDTEWLQSLWPKVKASLDYCIETWDPKHRGVLAEPHHNTYDIEFWGPDGMCTSIYLGALKAAAIMGAVLDDDVSRYRSLFEKGKKYCEEELYNGEYFYQRTRSEDSHTNGPTALDSHKPDDLSAEEVELVLQEGPKYQYREGCLSDGVIGAWLASVCGVGEILEKDKVASHLRSVYNHNFKKDLSQHANPQRPGYAIGKEGGLLLCTWPRGGRPSLPFPYSDEVWTGIEYQVASHLMMTGMVDEGLDIVNTCRDRYDGRVRNPFDEYEAGHWYGRALASYALLQGLTGVRYDAVGKTLYVTPALDGDFRAFLSTATGYGTVGVSNGKPFIEVRSGSIEVDRIHYKRE